MRVTLMLVVFAALLGLGACGQRGPLEPPPALAPKAQDKPAAEPARQRGEPPRKPFVLDALL